MTVIGGKQEAKSTRVLDAICKLDFFSLVDGHPAARWLIKRFITHADFTLRVKKWLIAVGALFGILLCGDIVLLGLQHTIPYLAIWTIVCFVLTGIFVLLAAVALSYAASLLKRLKNAGYGINPGDYFYDWIKLQLKSNGVNTVSDLKAKASAPITGLHIRPDTIHPEGLKDLTGDVTFITSELVTQNKVQFPAMCNLFRPGKNIDLLQPAGFIRASMSIPIFFESYIINDIPCTDEEIKNAWWDTFQEKEPPSSARFVDGGILSNFPINLFYNPGVISPRVPVFGIDLDDSKPGDERLNPASWSLGGYFGKVFNTIRNYYDKDFLIKNEVYGKGIGKIKVAGYNWLNFFLKPEDKIDMFMLGAEAATAFLTTFDWKDYKESRGAMQMKINQWQSNTQPTPAKSPTQPTPSTPATNNSKP
jgi:NTE family protein